MSLRSRLAFTEEPLYLMDGSAFVYRGFYAFQNMTRSDGFPTNALYIVARLLLRILREEQPRYFSFILDGKGKSFRNGIYAEYKAQRSATPEPLIQQLEPLERLLDFLGISRLVSADYEADDYIASLAERYRKSRPVVIIGADKDLKQCLHEQVVLWDPASKDERITTLKDFREQEHIEPSSWADYQALIGDSSDNIPGVPQIGPKTASKLIQDYPTLELLFEHLADLPQKLQNKLAGQEQNALKYRELTRLKTDVCQNVTEEQLKVVPPRMEPLMQFMQEFELRSLAREVASMERARIFADKPSSSTTSPAADKNSDLPLFSIDVKTTSNTPEETPHSPSSSHHSAPDSQNGKLEQGSLFAISSPTKKITVESVENVHDLPEFGAHIALIVQGDQEIHLASDSWERIYTGEPSMLADYVLAAKKTCITADIKAFCKQFPSFWNIPTKYWFDLSLAAYLLSPEERNYSWSSLAYRWGDLAGSPYDAQANPAMHALAIAHAMYEQLEGASLLPVFQHMEIPLVSVLAAMEKRGIRIDKNAFKTFLDEVQSKLDELTAEIYAHAGKTFNIRSSQQLGQILFSDLKLPHAGKTKGGASSTSQEALEKLEGKHPIIQSILDFRTLEKLRSTYLEPMPRLADVHERIHTTFNQTATATGRLSSSNPNLQNIPIRGAFGKRMRQCFVAAPGNKLVCADYSQIELRVLAHLSQDPNLLDAFHKNEDIHSRTAGLLFDVPVAEVTQTQRRNAKTINFGLIYGMGAQKLARELNISLKEAKEFIERYFSRLSKLKQFYDSIEESAKTHGYVVSMAGRRRLTPDILSSNTQLRAQARRQAINTRIQGSAADIIKLAMLAVENDADLQKLDAQLLLQIHDELVLEVPAEHAQAAAEKVNLLMRSVAPGGEKLTVPLVVDWGIGDTWGDAH